MICDRSGAVVDTAELETVHAWTGPGLDPATGCLPIGVTGAGQAVCWPLWRPGAGMTNGLVYGQSGNGKTTFLELVLREAEASDRLTPAVIDGAGHNLAHWAGCAAYAATDAAGAVDVLQRLLQDMRSRAAGRTAGRGAAPTPQEPWVVLIIEEAASLFDHPEFGDHLRSLMEHYLRMGRGLGFGAIASVYAPSAASFGSTVLRDAFTAGPVLALRTADPHGTAAFESRLGGLPPSYWLPHHWPDGSGTEGLGYLLDPDLAPVLCRVLLPR